MWGCRPSTSLPFITEAAHPALWSNGLLSDPTPHSFHIPIVSPEEEGGPNVGGSRGRHVPGARCGGPGPVCPTISRPSLPAGVPGYFSRNGLPPVRGVLTLTARWTHLPLAWRIRPAELPNSSTRNEPMHRASVQHRRARGWLTPESSAAESPTFSGSTMASSRRQSPAACPAS